MEETATAHVDATVATSGPHVISHVLFMPTERSAEGATVLTTRGTAPSESANALREPSWTKQETACFLCHADACKAIAPTRSLTYAPATPAGQGPCVTSNAVGASRPHVLDTERADNRMDLAIAP